MRFIVNIHNFSKFSKIAQSFKKLSSLCGDNGHLTSFLTKSARRRISSCQQDIKLDQFYQQNTNCRTAILQNSSLGAPIIKNRFMTTFIYIPGGLEQVWEQVWACISSLHLYCNYLEMIKAVSERPSLSRF